MKKTILFLVETKEKIIKILTVKEVMLEIKNRMEVLEI